jgi:hypothetical protein
MKSLREILELNSNYGRLSYNIDDVNDLIDQLTDNLYTNVKNGEIGMVTYEISNGYIFDAIKLVKIVVAELTNNGFYCVWSLNDHNRPVIKLSV